MTRVIDKITLTTSKQIGFPQAFTKKHSLLDYEGVLLYWNPEQKAVAVRFTNDMDAKGVMKLVKSDRYGAYVSVSTFLATYSIDPKEYQRRYDYDQVDPGLFGLTTQDPVFVFVLEPLLKQEDGL
ncbi:hypothetical protein JNM87_06730 [Candidatus Saccharibacteria bacterium]|nr:hypothetical protein [Candidatus Saccharibacteria bacterium]